MGPTTAYLLYRVVVGSKELLDVYFQLQLTDDGIDRELCIQCADETGISPQHTIHLPNLGWIPVIHFTQERYKDYNQWYDEQADVPGQACTQHMVTSSAYE